MKGFVKRRVAKVSRGDAVAKETLLWSSWCRDDMSLCGGGSKTSKTKVQLKNFRFLSN